MTGCYKIRRNMVAYIDGELDAEELAVFEEHLTGCNVCQNELCSIRSVVELCSELPLQELPPGFGEELHEKLLHAAEEQSKAIPYAEKARTFALIKTFASVAAGFLIIFLAGSFLRQGFFLRTGMRSKNDAFEMSKVTEASAAVLSENEGVVYSESGNEIDGLETPGLAEKSITFSAADGHSEETDRSAQDDERKSAIVGIRMMAAPEIVESKFSSINVFAESPENELEEIVGLIRSYYGNEEEPNDDALPGDGEETDHTAYFNNMERDRKAQEYKVLNYDIPQIDYEQFVSDLYSAFGTANVQVIAFVTEDMTDTLESDIARVTEIDILIRELQESNGGENKETIIELCAERDDINIRIESIRFQNDFVNVTIYINKK